MAPEHDGTDQDPHEFDDCAFLRDFLSGLEDPQQQGPELEDRSVVRDTIH